mmetsp:Transcript_17264/g.31352  ORF Transcript_17264/g.31352 Transcript_17264/m.31352 type:complete len:355 (-) Transcript_17264:101-1165(-)|eukprot:CAMPEP_0201887600 /NCGR_PEP_ID=MMETSP0902-20130614/25356_1 /ASSEMBLY_ACC=CAM_ASM_000551 /TAXON_ID=420261 /ORGANISM="Thalassiosira antarctica, Strain CCMP982" /LENGTH=354 /DNA_ID=CAMNT_0048417585 /DNA_START=54 /DNA_END=1118 /DNA_ORIENTATION=-
MARLFLSFFYRQRTTLTKTLRGQSPYSLSSFSSSPSSREPPKKNNDVLPSEQLDAATRAMGQVLFLNSVDSGRVIFLSLALGDPTLAGCAALGALTATSTSHVIGLDKKTWNDGLWGYNGALIGCAASVFGPSYFPYVVASTLLGAAATPVLSASLKSAINMPQWTWSFNFVALTSLLRTRPLPAPVESANGDQVVSISTGAGDLLMSPLLGISQIFVVGSPLTGAGIVAATYLYSPKLAVHALGGSATGCLVGLLSGADLSDVCMGLWGYNSALASMAVGTFFVNSRQTMVLSASSAAASAALFGAMQTLFGEFGAPCLTLPFCTVASACYLLEGHIPGLKLAKEPHSPEKNG